MSPFCLYRSASAATSAPRAVAVSGSLARRTSPTWNGNVRRRSAFSKRSRKPVRLRGAAREHDRQRLVAARQPLAARDGANQLLDQRLDQLVVVDVQRLVDLVAAGPRQVERLLLDRLHARRGLVHDRADGGVDEVAALRQAERQRRNRQIRQRDVAHAAAARNADAREALVRELGQHDGQTFVHRERRIAPLAQVTLQRLFVIGELVTGFGRCGRHGEREQLTRRARRRHERAEHRLEHVRRGGSRGFRMPFAIGRRTSALNMCANFSAALP